MTEPNSLNSFRCTPRLPQDWNKMTLANIRLFGENFDLHVYRRQGNLYARVSNHRTQKVEEQIIGGSGTVVFRFPSN